MEKLHSVSLSVGDQKKEIAVYCGDATAPGERIDVLTTSAFIGSYAPTPKTVFSALFQKGIDTEALAEAPEIDLRSPCHVWLSKPIPKNGGQIARIGCIELLNVLDRDAQKREESMLQSIRSYFRMLDIAAICGVKVATVALPLLGSGSQDVSSKLLLIPLLNECIAFLKRNPSSERILFIEINPEKAKTIADCLKSSIRFSEENEAIQPSRNENRTVFLSYASPDRNIADNLCFKLESLGVKVWYAPRNVVGPYAAAIANAIETATHFVVILSQNSIASEHVLNEIDLAFQKLPDGIKFKPLRIDNAMFTPSFKYYLSRQHWMDATEPPLEERLNEFVQTLLGVPH